METTRRKLKRTGALKMRYFVMLLALLFCTNVRAEDISIITRFPISSPSYQAMLIFVKKLNSIQEKYKFTPQTVPGALGENADQRTLATARSGKNVIWYGPISHFTFNRFEIGNTYDRDNDFYFLRSFLVTYQSLVVSKNSNVNTLEEFIKSLKNKNKTFYGVPLEVGAMTFLNNIFEKHTSTRSSMIKYKDFAEVVIALNNKEIDYSIMPFPSVRDSLLELDKTKYDAHIIPKFRYETLTAFAVPKEIKNFAILIKPLFDSLCGDQELIQTYSKLKYDESCDNDTFIKQRITEEVKMISEFK